MSKNLVILLASCWLWLSGPMVMGQTDSLLREADRLLNYKAYGRAIDAYTQLLTEQANGLTPAQKVTVQSRLAYAYKQVGDDAKAERHYREALNNNPKEDPQQTLQYAQTLASNGKFQEAQQQYERYLRLQEKTPQRRPAPGPLSSSAEENRRPTRYRLEYLDINSSGEEFSPAFYRDGLVYVYGTKGGSAIETKGKGGGSGYLDLFYIPNRGSIRAGSVVRADGRTVNVKTDKGRTDKGVGSDFYTRSTANDSPTIPGFAAGINIAQGLGYNARTVNPSKQFSKSLNTKYHEGPATFTQDGSRIYFTRNNFNDGRARKSTEGVNKLKLYTARQQNGVWADIEELPFNSDEYSVGHPTLSRDGQLLYFASDMPGGEGGTDLYMTRYDNGRWSKPVNLGNGINTKGNELFPFVDDAGNLYFSTDGRRGQGGLDIFFASVTNGATIQAVVPLDAPINSPQDDFGLITDANRQGGYFSSNRRAGNDDIYRFVRESSLFNCRDLSIRLYDTDTEQSLDSVTVLVKTRGEGRADQTIFTDKDGFAQLCLEVDNDFTFQASRDGYLTSTVGFATRNLTDDQPSRIEIGITKPTMSEDTIENNSTGVYTWGPLTRSRVRGVVVSERDRKPLEGVTVRLRNECDRSQRQYVTGPDGRYVFDLVEGCDYTLVASKPAFGTNTNRIKRLPKKASNPKEVAADLRMLSVGDVVMIDNIYYNFGGYDLRADASRELDKLVATMRKYPSLIIEIRSHTDSRGDAARNKALSEQRAKAVASYLTSKGISRKRIATVGMGESQLVNNCTDDVICTEAEHQRNRRTEFRVVAIK